MLPAQRPHEVHRAHRFRFCENRLPLAVALFFKIASCLPDPIQQTPTRKVASSHDSEAGAAGFAVGELFGCCNKFLPSLRRIFNPGFAKQSFVVRQRHNIACFGKAIITALFGKRLQHPGIQLLFVLPVIDQFRQIQSVTAIGYIAFRGKNAGYVLGRASGHAGGEAIRGIAAISPADFNLRINLIEASDGILQFFDLRFVSLFGAVIYYHHYLLASFAGFLFSHLFSGAKIDPRCSDHRQRYPDNFFHASSPRCYFSLSNQNPPQRSLTF